MTWRKRSGIAALVLLAAALTGTLGGARVTLADSPPDNTVTVQGEGVVTAPPDTAIVRLGVEVQAQTVAAARSQAASTAAAVIAAVKADGVADADIQTVEVDINPMYDSPNGQQVLTGYRAGNILQIKIRSIGNAGQVIDDAVAAGGNAAVVQGISFTIDDTTALAHQGRMLAIQDAHASAQDYATAAGLTLGRVVQIVEQSSPTPVPVAAAAPRAPSAAFAPTPVQGGSLEVRVDVSVSYLIQ